jgi:dsRNA-specific ribonuclease
MSTTDHRRKGTESPDSESKNITQWFKDGDFKNHMLNEANIPITKEFIEGVFKKYNFNHKVKNLELFQLAMVHISYLNRTTITEKTARILKDVIPIENDKKNKAMPLKDKTYGRLEYLGDAVIHNVLAEYLFDRYEGEDEGFLTKLRTKLEKDESLSRLSKKIGLQKYAIIARNIEQAGGRLNNVHLTEDIFEAFIGALSKETKYERCKEFLISLIEKEIDIAELLHNDDNYKDRLMQYFHKMKWSEPKYNEDVSQQKNTKEGCLEIRSYTTYIKNPEGKIIGVGQGNSKPKSEQNAAYNALVTLGVINEQDNNSDYYGEISDSDSDSDDEFMSDKGSNSEESSSEYYDTDS